MHKTKDILIEAVRERSEREAAYLAGEFARAASEEREAILAAMDFERWLAECCADARTGLPRARNGRL